MAVVVGQETSDEMLAHPRDVFGEVDVGTFLPGQPIQIVVRISAGLQDVERDTQRPDRGGLALDPTLLEIFRWMEIVAASEALVGFLGVRAASKVDEFDGMGARIHENVLRFDVTVDDSLGLDLDHRFHQSAEEFPDLLMRQLGGVHQLAKIHSAFHVLHDDHQVGILEASIDELDHTVDVRHTVENAHFQWQLLVVRIHPSFEEEIRDDFDGHRQRILDACSGVNDAESTVTELPPQRIARSKSRSVAHAEIRFHVAVGRHSPLVAIQVLLLVFRRKDIQCPSAVRLRSMIRTAHIYSGWG